MPWYNLLMSVVDAAVIVHLLRNRRPGALAAAAFAAGGAAVVLAGLLGGGLFGVMRLAAYGLFVHAVLLLLVAATLFWWSTRRLSVGCAVLAGVLLGLGLDAFLIEPSWLEVTRYRIVTPKIRKPVRIVVLADLQTDRLGNYERRVLRRMLEEKPDLVLLAGDYLQTGALERSDLAERFNDYFHQLDMNVPLGVVAVLGNVDGDVRGLFDGLPIRLLRQSTTIEVGPLDLTGLAYYDSTDAEIVVERPRADRFHIVLGHAPDFALGEVQADLMVAGHTHGGQVRLPGVGPLMTFSRVPRDWAAGMTELPDGRRLLVSRGVGMERGDAPRMRLLCRPELAVIDLVCE